MVQLQVDDNAFKRLSLDETLRRVFSVYSTGFVLFTQIAFLTQGTNICLWSLIVRPVLLWSFNVTTDDLIDPLFAMEHPGIFFLLLVPNVILGTIVSAIAAGSMMKAVAHVYLNDQHRINSVQCLQFGLKKSPVIIVTSLLYTLGVALGFLAIFVPGIYLMVVWYLYLPAVVLEKKQCDSFRRSTELVGGEWCYVFCTLSITGLVMLISQGLWSGITLGGNDVGHTLYSTYGSIIAAIPAIFYLPFSSIIVTVMYINMRVEKEGLNAEVLKKDLEISSLSVLEDHDYDAVAVAVNTVGDYDDDHKKQSLLVVPEDSA